MSAVLHPQYITDETGKRISVILSFEEYRALLEDMEDFRIDAIAAQRLGTFDTATSIPLASMLEKFGLANEEP